MYSIFLDFIHSFINFQKFHIRPNENVSILYDSQIPTCSTCSIPFRLTGLHWSRQIMGSFFSQSSSQSYSSDTQLVQYDQQAAIQAAMHDMSDFTSATALRDHLQPGDLIQKKGNFFMDFFYSHWAVYIGNGEIVHVIAVEGSSAKADIVRQNMETAFQGTNVRKNNHMDEFWTPRLRPIIVIAARNLVGTPWAYNLVSKNCEHFASFCRYGREISLQSFGLFDIKSGAISFGEYVCYHMKAAKEKCATFVSWIKRKISPYLPAIGSGSFPAIIWL